MTVLTAARANIIGDLNLWTCAQLLRRTGSPENLRIVLHPRMVHGKAIVGDGAWVDIGSTNFTSPSHGGYEEVDLFCRDAAFAKRVEDAIEHDIRDGKPAKLPIRYRRPVRRHRADARFVPRAQEEVEGQREEVEAEAAAGEHEVSGGDGSRAIGLAARRRRRRAAVDVGRVGLAGRRSDPPQLPRAHQRRGARAGRATCSRRRR